MNSGSTGGCSGGLFPEALIDAVKSEARMLGLEQRTRTFSVEYYVRDGILREAIVHGRGSMIVVPLSS